MLCGVHYPSDVEAGQRLGADAALQIIASPQWRAFRQDPALQAELELLRAVSAKANRGLLYVDEVNLLDDHLVDVLLDSAASGWNTVEREGVSVRHPARFVLIGSGNPEEGELRPQLLDRFGMSVEVRTVRDPELRVQVVDQRTAFDSDPDGFNNAVQTAQDALQDRVIAAQKLLNQAAIAAPSSWPWRPDYAPNPTALITAYDANINMNR